MGGGLFDGLTQSTNEARNNSEIHISHFARCHVIGGAEMVRKFINHSKKAICIAQRYGWLPGARYTNLRDVRAFKRLGLLDRDWRDYNFQRHLEVTRLTCPLMTVARDIERRSQIRQVVAEAADSN